MTKKLEVYKCEVCGNIVEVLHTGAGSLVCCGKPMKLQDENVTDAAREKHVPVVEKTDLGFTVRVGTVAHPMEDRHHIEWVELVADGRAYRQFLDPGELPEAVFRVDVERVSVRAYCNLHGLWKG